MSRQKLSAQILDLRGAYKNHPERRPDGNEAVGVGELTLRNCPKSLNVKEAEVWKEIFNQLPDGVKTKSDAPMIELCARLWCELRTKKGKFQSSKLGTVIKCFDRLGLTFNGRSSIIVQKPKEKDEYK